jgi:hypothetical protein
MDIVMTRSAERTSITRVRVEEQSRQVLKRLGPRITEAESLVGTVVRIYERGLDRDWDAARRLFAGMWRPARPSRELPDQRWLALAIGQSVTLRWPRQRAGARQRRSPAERAVVPGHARFTER